MKISSTLIKTFGTLLAALWIFETSAQCTTATISGIASGGFCGNASGSTLTASPAGGFFTGPGMINSTFFPALAGPGTKTLTYNYGACTNSYVLTTNTVVGDNSPTYSIVNTTNLENSVSLSDDQLSGGLPIGFTFTFFCNAYTTFYISSNGFITFNSGAGNGCCSGQSLPNNTTPDNLIACDWNDLYPPNGGTISYATIGTAPNRTLCVNYNGIAHYNGGSYCCPIIQQIRLAEGSNIIEIHTNTKPIPTSTYNETMGISNSGGSVGFAVPGRNAAVWSASVEAVRFTPVLGCSATQTVLVYPTTASVSGTQGVCTGNSTTLTANSAFTGPVTYSWSGGSSSTASNIVVNPTSNTSYSIAVTNSASCVANAVANVTVFSGAPTVSASASSNSVCAGKSVTLTATGAPNYSWTNGVTNGVGFTPTVTASYVATGFNSCGSNTVAVTVSVGPLPVSTAASSNVICAGNPVTLTAVSTATTYTWSPGNIPGASPLVTPTANTAYTVTASDGTCFGTSVISITANPIPTISAIPSSSNVCAGSTVTLTASGGLTYSWTTLSQTNAVIVITPTASGAYNVSGTNSLNCSSSAQAIVIIAQTPTLTAVAADALVCNGGSTTLTATGANSTYSWSTGGTTSTITVTPTGLTNYTVYGTSNSNTCVGTATVNVDVFTPSVTITGNTVICNGEVVTLTGNGADSYSWSWGSNTLPFQSVNDSPSTTTIYTLTSLTNTLALNCADTQTYQVTVNPTPTLTAAAQRTAMCRAESNTLTATSAPTCTFSWSNLSSTSSTVVITPTLITTLNYTVSGTTAQGCTNTAVVQIKINSCVGISENDPATARLAIFPNPSNGQFTVSYNSDIVLEISNQLGQKIRKVELNEANHFTTNISGLADGVYFVTGEKNGRNISQKIVVTK